MMNTTPLIIAAVSFALGWLFGWACRTAAFIKDHDCADPRHQDWDYRKER